MTDYWNPGDFFYHCDYGYQMVSLILGDCLIFWGQECVEFIDEKVEVESKPIGRYEKIKVPISQVTKVSFEQVKNHTLAKNIVEQETVKTGLDNYSRESTMSASQKEKADKVIAQIKGEISSRKKQKINTTQEVSGAIASEKLKVPVKLDPPVNPELSLEPDLSFLKKKIIPAPFRIVVEESCERFYQTRETLRWLDFLGLPALPIAPIYDPDRFGEGQGFNTKNPSWLDSKNEPHQIRWERFAEGGTPTTAEKARWFAHDQNGVGTISGRQNIYWFDIDRKHFDNDAACKEAAMTLWDKLGRTGLLEKTQSNGWHIAFRYQGTPFKTFSFSLKEGEPVIGEVLGIKHFVVLSPTVGRMGDYENLYRLRDIPTIDFDDLGIVKKYYKKTHNSEVYKNQNYVRFPAALYRFYKSAAKLWVLARAKDKKGSGVATLRMTEVQELVNRGESTIRRWISKGIKKGLFSARTYVKNGEKFITIYYISKERACLINGLTGLGPVGLIDITRDLATLHIAATDIIAQELQRKSRHAQFQEQVEKFSQAKGVDKKLAEKKATKPLRPELLGDPCENKTARVLSFDDRFVYCSERLAAYGASLASVSKERGLSLRQTNRHLTNSYRAAPSPVWGYREDMRHISKRQIVQRLSKSQMNDFLYEGIQHWDSENGTNNQGKYGKDKAGRYWERKCCVIAPHFRLVSCRFRRWKLAKIVTLSDRLNGCLNDSIAA